MYITSVYARIRALFFVRSCVRTRRLWRRSLIPIRDLCEGKCYGHIKQGSSSERLLADGDDLDLLLIVSL